MRLPILPKLEACRRIHPILGAGERGKPHGYFESGPLRIVSSGTDHPDNLGWEHVSVSCSNRCPTWDEMCKVKWLFWDDSETVLQFHPAKKDYVNQHPFCLHLWKKIGENAELPPKEFV